MTTKLDVSVIVILACCAAAYFINLPGKGSIAEPGTMFKPSVVTATVKVTYTTPQDIIKRCGEVPGMVVLGCAQWWESSGQCEILVPFPKNKDDLKAFQIMGHELYHCTHGGFHNE